MCVKRGQRNEESQYIYALDQSNLFDLSDIPTVFQRSPNEHASQTHTAESLEFYYFYLFFM